MKSQTLLWVMGFCAVILLVGAVLAIGIWKRHFFPDAGHIYATTEPDPADRALLEEAFGFSFPESAVVRAIALKHGKDMSIFLMMDLPSEDAEALESQLLASGAKVDDDHWIIHGMPGVPWYLAESEDIDVELESERKKTGQVRFSRFSDTSMCAFPALSRACREKEERDKSRRFVSMRAGT